MIFTAKHRDAKTVEILAPDGSLFCVATTSKEVADTDPDCWMCFQPDGSGVELPPIAELVRASWGELECWGSKPVPELVIVPFEQVSR